MSMSALCLQGRDCVSACVCTGIPYVMETRCPHKDSNTSQFCPCGGIFFLPIRKPAYKSYKIKFF